MSSGAPGPPILVATQPGIGQHIGPAARDGEGQYGIVQLALGVRRRSVPTPLAPEDVVQIGIGMLVHARAQVDQPLRSLDQSREDVGGERVDREDVWQAVGGETVGLAIADSGIVGRPKYSQRRRSV